MSAYPGVRVEPGFSYDSLRNRIWMYGGANGTSLQDFWYLDLSNVQWVLVAATNPPGVRAGPYFAYDPNRDTLVIYGGFSGGAFLNTIYEYNCATSGPWTLKAPAHAPAVGVASAESDPFQYDPVRHTLVMFGGRSGIPFPDGVDTSTCWEWNGTDWTQRASGPAAREGHGWLYDSVRQKFLMVGGTSWAQQNLALETWEFDNAANTWTSRGNQAATGGPLGWCNMSLFQRPSDGKIIGAFGGHDVVGGTPQVDPQQWEWDGAAGTWTRNNTVTLPFLRRGVTAAGMRLVVGQWIPSLGCFFGFGGFNGWATGSYQNYQWSSDGTYWNALTSKRKQSAFVGSAGGGAKRDLNQGME